MDPGMIPTARSFIIKCRYWVAFGNEDAQPSSLVCLRDQKDSDEVYRIKDDPTAAFGCLGTVTGDVGKSAGW
jgi:hypothetical protein